MARRNRTTDHKAQGLGEKKLATSGLTMDDAKLLHMQCLGSQQTSRLHPSFKQLCSLKISYLGPDGEPLPDWHEADPFYRLRYLETPTDFDAVTQKKPVRYVQAPNTAPVAYYPQNFDGWVDLCMNPDEPLIITEGELKAAKACKEGFPTLGLGGVYNWRSNRLGIEWLPSLAPIEWRKRNVYLCFDSDYKTNPMVCAALRDFANELQRRGAFCYLVALPQLPGLDKIGLDDFLVHAGPSANEMFRELLTLAEPLGLAAPLWEYNKRYVYIRKPGLVVDQQDMENKVSPGAFKDHLESTANYQERQIKADGSISFKAVSAAGAWLKWPLRLEAMRLTYEPGDERFTKKNELNTWPGWGCEAKAGKVELFLKLLEHLFNGTEPEAMQWFLRWCAQPLQTPGIKMFSSVVIHGIKHGTGKSLVGYTLARIYGKNFTEINQMDLHNNFNEWAESKQFVMGDDVTGSNKRQDADFLKKMITQKELRINAKYTPSYVVPDCINYFFTSQHPDSFFLEDDDRRFFIHEVLVGPQDEEFYTDYMGWLENGGAEAVFDYLLKLDLGDFNPAAPAYRTAAKERMINTGRSDLGSWVRQLIATPDQVLRVGDVVCDKDLLTSKELLLYYDPEGRTGTTANGLGRELSRAGIRQVSDGKPIRLPDGSQARYYAVRNADQWLTAQPQALVSHLTGDEKPTRRKRRRKY
jgi:hypothetical protein